MKLIQTQQSRFFRHVARDTRERLGLAGERIHALMHFLHEAMKMNAPLAGHRCTVEKTVHQKTLAAAHAAPQIKALHHALARQQANEQGLHCFEADQVFVEALQMLDGFELRRIQREAVFGCVLHDPLRRIGAVER